MSSVNFIWSNTEQDKITTTHVRGGILQSTVFSITSPNAKSS